MSPSFPCSVHTVYLFLTDKDWGWIPLNGVWCEVLGVSVSGIIQQDSKSASERSSSCSGWERRKHCMIQNKYICLQTKIRSFIYYIGTWFQCDSRERWSYINHNPCCNSTPLELQFRTKLSGCVEKRITCGPNEAFIHVFSNKIYS